jgi:hypothetical protein
MAEMRQIAAEVEPDSCADRGRSSIRVNDGDHDGLSR